MKKETLIKSLLALAAAALTFASCQKENTDPQPEPQPEPVVTHEKLVSAQLTKAETLADAKKTIESVTDTTFTEVFKASLFGSNLVDFQIATYKITYRSVVRTGNGYSDAILTGTASFVVDKTGKLLPNRTLESVSLMNTIYNTSALDITLYMDYLQDRAIFNALVVCPYYQGGSTTDGCTPAPSEFLMKSRQAIDCELAALELIESMDNVQMAANYYTENYGLSNGGGPALGIPYLLQNDVTYKNYADKINLKATFVGEGNCSNTALLPNYLKKYSSEDGGTQIGSFVLDMTKLAGAAYISTVAGTYDTWQDKYFRDIKLEDYFSADFLATKDPTTGLNLLESFQQNKGSLLYSSFMGKIPAVEKIVNPDLLIFDKTDSTYTFNTEEGSIINDLNKAFSENEVITSGWTPKSDIVIAHSISDEFLDYSNNLKIWTNLSLMGLNHNVHMRTVYGYDHYDACEFWLKSYVLLRPHIVID